MKEDQKKAFEDLYSISGIPIVIMDGEGKSIYAVPNQFMDAYTKSFVKELQNELLKYGRPEDVLCFYAVDEFYLGVEQLSENIYLLTAPVNFTDNKEIPKRLYSKVKITPEKMPDFNQLISAMPSMDCNRLANVCSLCRQVYSEKPVYHIDVVNSDLVSSAAEDESSDNVFSNRPEQIEPVKDSRREAESPDYSLNLGTDPFIQNEYLAYIEKEQRLSEAIKEGDYQKFSRIYKSSVSSQDTINNRQLRNEFIGHAFYFSRAAIEGGAPIKLCLEISDYYCCQAEDVFQMEGDISALLDKMCQRFCEAVTSYKKQNSYSSYTKLCCDYINKNLMKKITMDDLESATCLNRRSLSEYFKRDTGIGIAEYIQSQRLDEAAYLLSCTKIPLAQISEMLLFSSQSYFGKRFKNIYGMTPQEYRKKNQR